MTYAQAVAALESTIGKNKRNYMAAQPDPAWFLERTRRFFDRLGKPEEQFDYVHIAGSSGKGSTAMMIYEGLHREGRSVGVYTSPYVSAPIENLGINGKLVGPEMFAEAVERVMTVFQAVENEEPEWTPSYSELFFAVAIDCFAADNVDIVVLETGCGGRFDKTNIIPTPRATVLTPLTFDHTDILGKTIEEIAWHKAGIIKNGSTVLSTERNEDARTVFEKEAASHQTAITYVEPKKVYATAMPGAHQQVNAAGAAAALGALGVSEQAIDDGIAAARLPARTERMPQSKNAPAVMIDGAHSLGKIEALIDSIDEKDWNRIHLVFSAKETKSVEDILTPLASVIHSATMTAFSLPGFGSHDPQICADTLAKHNPEIPIRVEADPVRAVEKTLEHAEPNDLVLITGSLYAAGILRQHWYPIEAILAQQTAFPI